MHWWLPIAVAGISALIAAGGNSWREALKYDRLAIADGEWWRLVTAHVTHLGGAHLGMNAAALFLAWLLVGDRMSAAYWLVCLAVTVLAIDLGFWLLEPNLLWYVGLSGLLHGMLLAGAMAGLTRSPGESLVIIAVVLAKLAYEQIVGPMPGSASVAGGQVVVEAHLYGGLGGLLAGFPMWRRAASGRPI